MLNSSSVRAKPGTERPQNPGGVRPSSNRCKKGRGTSGGDRSCSGEIPGRGQKWEEGLAAHCAKGTYWEHIRGPSGTFKNGHENFTESQESDQGRRWETE